MSGACAFCGHPNAEHRIVDAICERIEAGEPRGEVLEDYGWSEERLNSAILACLGTGGRRGVVAKKPDSEK